jgi:hypothetical protein
MNRVSVKVRPAQPGANSSLGAAPSPCPGKACEGLLQPVDDDGDLAVLEKLLLRAERRLHRIPEVGGAAVPVGVRIRAAVAIDVGVEPAELVGRDDVCAPRPVWPILGERAQDVGRADPQILGRRAQLGRAAGQQHAHQRPCDAHRSHRASPDSWSKADPKALAQKLS